MQNVNCFLLSYVKFGDNDAILHCFSAESGYQSFFAKGLYSSRNKKKAYLFPLNRLNITVLPKKTGGGMPNVSKIEMLERDYDFSDVKTNTVLLFVSDFLNQVLRDETHRNSAFFEIQTFLRELYKGNAGSYPAFIFKILAQQGLSPLPGNGHFLDPEAGNFSIEQSHSFFDEEISAVWKHFTEAEDIYSVTLKRSLRRQFLDSVMLYYKLHFAGFTVPNSLDIIQQIYE